MRSLFWVSAILIVISCLASVKLWRELRDERQLAAAVVTQQSRATGRAVVEPAAPRTVPFAQATPAIPAPVPVAESVSTNLKPAQDISSRLRDAALQQQELLKDPEYRKARIAQARVSVVRDNPLLAEELGLSPAEANRLFDLIAENSMEMTGSLAMDVVGGRAQASSFEARLQERAEQSRQNNQRISELLGPAKFARWQQYEQNAPARSRASSMGNMLAQAGQPLNPAQLRSLTAVMVTETRRQNEEPLALPRIDPQDPAARAQMQEVMRNREAETNRRILAAAATVMSAQQLATVRAQIESQEALGRAMSRARERVTATSAQEK